MLPNEVEIRFLKRLYEVGLSRTCPVPDCHSSSAMLISDSLAIFTIPPILSSTYSWF